MIRVAAAGDLHFGLDSAGTFRRHVERVDERADVLLLAGDDQQAEPGVSVPAARQ